MAHDRCCKYKSKGLTASSEILLDFLSENKLEGKSVLEIGCGTGFFSLETLRHGASSCFGVDLSAVAIKEANAFTRESGLQDRATFQVADGASARVPSSDIVVMDKVLCCYPDASSLLKTSIEASKQALGFVVPRDEGWMKPFMRSGEAVINLVERLRRTGFKFYLHPLEKIDRQLVDAGFQRSKKAQSRVWLIFLYKRNTNVTP